MPNAELIRINFQEYENGRLTEDTVSYDVKDIANGNVYLYKVIGDLWNIAVGTPPSSYSRLPMLVGKIATKTVNGATVKLFFRNGDDETQFDELNSGKVDKQSWTTLLTATTTEDAVFQLDDTSAGVDLNSYEEIQINIELPSAATTYPKYSWYYNGAYGNGVNCTVAGTNFRWWVMNFKKVNGMWWAESRCSDTIDRLGYLFKNIYRENATGIVMANLVGVRLYLTSTSDLPSGTKIRIWGLK